MKRIHTIIVSEAANLLIFVNVCAHIMTFNERVYLAGTSMGGGLKGARQCRGNEQRDISGNVAGSILCLAGDNVAQTTAPSRFHWRTFEQNGHMNGRKKRARSCKINIINRV